MTKYTLVTGGTGFLGTHICNLLLQQNTTSKLILLARNTPEKVKDGVSYLSCDIRELSKCEDERLLQLDGIYHLAGMVHHSRQNAEDVFNINVKATLEVMKLAARNKCKVVYASSSGVAGVSKDPAKCTQEEDDYAYNIVTKWPYYHSKMLSEQKAILYAWNHKVPLVILRPSVLYGPEDYQGRATRRIYSFMKSGIPCLTNGGYNFLDVRDAAAAFVKAMELENTRLFYYLGGFNGTLKEFLLLLDQVTPIKIPRLKLPFRVVWSLSVSSNFILGYFNKAGLILPDPVLIEMAYSHWNINSDLAREELDFKNRDYKETLEETVGWIKENQEVFLKKKH